jgi:hypothetical protein
MAKKKNASGVERSDRKKKSNGGVERNNKT